MLKGIDISHHNTEAAIKRALADSQFCIIKASEGATHNDKMLVRNWRLCDEAKIELRGLYHYARPQNNEPYTEAANFCGAIKKVLPKMDGKTILVIDWEGSAQKCPSDWAVKWAHIVEMMTGVKPLIYCQPWNCRDNAEAAARDNMGLWVPRYNGNPFDDSKRGFNANKLGSVFPWRFFAMWQWTSTPIDKDIFNGGRTGFLNYAKVN